MKVWRTFRVMMAWCRHRLFLTIQLGSSKDWIRGFLGKRANTHLIRRTEHRIVCSMILSMVPVWKRKALSNSTTTKTYEMWIPWHGGCLIMRQARNLWWLTQTQDLLWNSLPLRTLRCRLRSHPIRHFRIKLTINSSKPST